MITLIISLFLFPLFASAMVLLLPKSLTRVWVIGSSLALAVMALYLFFTIHTPVEVSVPLSINTLVAIADILLLLYFGFIAVKKKNVLVGIMSALQLAGLFYLLYSFPNSEEKQFYIDRLSLFMFLLINVISGVIAVFSLKYIEEEQCSEFRKRFFISIIFCFVGVMNMIVSANNLEFFFLLFELTTLASYLFISFRKDELSVKNALTALWMNQIGGLAILAAILLIEYNQLGIASFTNLLSHGKTVVILLPVALLCIGALIKGAQMPFSKWLLGAMVAPTPVSALLHSSTMVKIAPFIILRLSPVLKGTPVATVIIGLTAFVFVSAAIGSLAQNNFKKILAHSTIALLALMILLGSVGTPVAIIACISLVMFHGISKCLLFLNAGVLERKFHLKNTSDMDKLGETGPFTSFVVVVGFMSLLLPPFGAFIGKWVSIETLSRISQSNQIVNAVVLVAIASGGAVLSLLYFKVLGILISRSGATDKIKFEKTSWFYMGPLIFLLGLIITNVFALPYLFTGVFIPVASQTVHISIPFSIQGFSLIIGGEGGLIHLPFFILIASFLLLPLTLVISSFIRFKKVDRAKEYMCGEKIDYRFSSFYLSAEKANPYFIAIGILFFVALIVVSI